MQKVETKTKNIGWYKRPMKANFSLFLLSHLIYSKYLQVEAKIKVYATYNGKTRGINRLSANNLVEPMLPFKW